MLLVREISHLFACRSGFIPPCDIHSRPWIIMAASRLAEDVRRCLNNDSKFCSISWCASKFTMSDPTKRPQSRDGRTKSAIARLKTPPEHHLKHGGVAKDDHERKQRVKSARLNRDKHVSSKKVFPRPSSADKERYRTQYARDFEGFRYTLPISARPTSPTRRNNPHPTKVHGVKLFAGLMQMVHSALSSCSNSWCGECLPARLGCLQKANFQI